MAVTNELLIFIWIIVLWLSPLSARNKQGFGSLSGCCGGMDPTNFSDLNHQKRPVSMRHDQEQLKKISAYANYHLIIYLIWSITSGQPKGHLRTGYLSEIQRWTHMMIYTCANLCCHSDHFSSEQRQAEVTLFCQRRNPIPSCFVLLEKTFLIQQTCQQPLLVWS